MTKESQQSVLTSESLSFSISQENRMNGNVPIIRHKITLPQNCEVEIDEENGEIVVHHRIKLPESCEVVDFNKREIIIDE